MNKKFLVILIIFALSAYLLYGCVALAEPNLDGDIWQDDNLQENGDLIQGENTQSGATDNNSINNNVSGSDIDGNTNIGSSTDNTNAGSENNTGGNNDNQTQQEEKTKFATYIQASTSVNIRSGAGTGYAVVGKMDKGDMLAYKGKNGAWYQTIYKEKIAYVSVLYTELFKIEEGSGIVEDVIAFGQTLLGYPYVWGAERYHWGNSNLNTNFINGRFDCSSFTQYIYYIKAGVVLSLTTRTQVVQGIGIEKSQIKRGDLLFFTNSSRRHLTGTERVGHVAVYLGRNYILHTASDFAVIEEISPYRWNDYITARRVI